MKNYQTLLILMFLSLGLGSCMTQYRVGPNPVVEAELIPVSPYMSPACEARFEITVRTNSGAGLNPAMLDRGCFRIRLESGKVITPKSEGITDQPVVMGSRALIARTVDLKDALAKQPTQTIEVWWEYGKKKTEPVSERLYEWDLEEIEAVIQTAEGDMAVSFFPRKAPITVKNFVDLCLDGFYDGLTFHRVVSGFMIQGGCPLGDGTGDPGYNLIGEFTDISHERGVISMARSQDPDSAGCQFFIMHADNPNLDWQYAAFGKMTSGFDTLDALAAKQVTHQRNGGEASRPIERLEIEKIVIRPKSPGAGEETGSPQSGE
jgi:cyclophilin family peptidyl-prolyl cis-trans isomerase